MKRERLQKLKILNAVLLSLLYCLITEFAVADIFWGNGDGYWSDPSGWRNNIIPTGEAKEKNVRIAGSYVVSVTNGDEVVCQGLAISSSGTLKMTGGQLTAVSNSISSVSWIDNETANIEVWGGSLCFAGDLYVANKGYGTFRLIDGESSINTWLSLGQNVNSTGRLLVTGGSLIQRNTDAKAGVIIGYKGNGMALIGGAANVTVNGGYGLHMGGYTAEGIVTTNLAVLSTGGTLATKKISSVGNESIFLLDGGNLCSMEDAEAFITKKNSDEGTELSVFGMTDRGGIVDTCGHNVTFNQALTTVAVGSVSNLVHRWSFNGDAKDSIGGTEATLNGTASLSIADGKIALPGGDKGTSWVNLGGGLLPDGNDGFTIELWGTIVSTNAQWLRCFDIGNNSGYKYNLYSCWMNNKNLPALLVQNGEDTLKIAVGEKSYSEGRVYHIVVVAVPDNNAGWTIKQYVQDAHDGDVLDSYSLTPPEGWSPSSQLDDFFMLGHSAGNNPDANCFYDEVRIWDRPLSEWEIMMNNAAGPDAVAGDFVKAGEGTLTMTGENTFTVPVRVETGTLALAANSTLAEDCDVTIATNAVLSLASGSYPKGNIAVEVDEFGQAGCVSSSVALDLSRINFSIANPDALSKDYRYTIATSAGGFIGTVASINIPPRWVLTIGVDSVTISYQKGLAIIFR